MWGIIATWRMALEGVTESASALAAGKPVSAAVVDAVAAVEDLMRWSLPPSRYYAEDRLSFGELSWKTLRSLV
ncbi:hypothetical protein RF039_16350, partial [Enterobacter sichuanensis]|nr:hypothetical protein [Enterobacter sichuanensis]